MWLRVLALVLLVGCSQGELPGDAGPVGHDDEVCELPVGARDIATEFMPYGELTWQRAALVRPVAPSGRPRPVLVFVHGGGWVGGNLHEHLPLAEHYAARGWIAASVTYQLATDGPTWPQPAMDVGCALKWAQDNAVQWGGDPDDITLFGTSAGGHLVAHVGVGSVVAACGQLPPRRVVVVSAPAALTALTERDRVFPRAISLLGGPPDDLPAAWEEASAQTAASLASSPFVVVHGDRDRTVSLGVADQFVEALHQAGAEPEYRVITGVRHGFERIDSQRTRLQCYLEPFLNDATP
jgi:acetyl esterase/lipase